MRTNFERLALRPFEDAARAASHVFFKGQGLANRVAISRQVYWQFGDLRVDLPDRRVIVEVESAGGVTNLLKYWLSNRMALDLGRRRGGCFRPPCASFGQESLNERRASRLIQPG